VTDPETEPIEIPMYPVVANPDTVAYLRGLPDIIRGLDLRIGELVKRCDELSKRLDSVVAQLRDCLVVTREGVTVCGPLAEAEAHAELKRLREKDSDWARNSGVRIVRLVTVHEGDEP